MSTSSNKPLVLYLQGGLGNQLFQYNAALNFSTKKNMKFIVSKSGYFRGRFPSEIRKQRIKPDIFDIYNFESNKEHFPNLIDIYQYRLIKRFYRSLSQRNLLLNEENYKQQLDAEFTKVRYIVGHFESNEFMPDESMLHPIRSRLRETSERHMATYPANFLAVHIRLGDLAQQGRVYIPGCEYFVNAIHRLREIVGQYPVMIFSDDIEEVMKSYSQLLKEKDVTFAIKGSSSQHLYAMSCAKGLVCSNSTLSWWAVRLSNGSSPVIIPFHYLKIDNDLQKNQLFWRLDHERIPG
jgi:Glycosyl transferase family 11